MNFGPGEKVKSSLWPSFFANKRVAIFAALMLAFCLFAGLWVASIQTIASRQCVGPDLGGHRFPAGGSGGPGEAGR